MIGLGFTGFVTDLRQSSALLYTRSELPNPGLCVFLAHALSRWAGLSPHSYSPGQNQCLKYHSDPLLAARLQETKKTLHYSNHAWNQDEAEEEEEEEEQEEGLDPAASNIWIMNERK